MGRKIEDIAGETRLSPQMFALAKAQATGNPLALEKIKLEYEIKNLTLLARHPLQPAGPLQQSPATAERRIPDCASQRQVASTSGSEPGIQIA
jgi:hypothetical protein